VCPSQQLIERYIAYRQSLGEQFKANAVSCACLAPPRPDPALKYPCRLHTTVLKGYFGEVFAGLLAENIPVAGRTDWEVPAFLFRNHRLAFHQLERYRQAGQLPGPMPGRLGDDCLGFRRNARGTIVAVLYCESKCTAGHDSTMIADAHKEAVQWRRRFRIDPAGYVLAKSRTQRDFDPNLISSCDFRFDPVQKIVTSSWYL
jgi:hypothetical protein